MKRFLKAAALLISAVLCTASANSVYFVCNGYAGAAVFIALFGAGLLFSLLGSVGKSSARLFFLDFGNSLLKVFLISLIPSAVWHTVLLFLNCEGFRYMWLISLLTVFLSLALVFWLGMILVYCLSVQMGLRRRFAGLLLGFVPVANIVMLFKIIRVAGDEVELEDAKIKLNKQRSGRRVCATGYPILLVHGVFFRDFKHLNYWGRIPAELIKNGATVYYGEQNSASSVADSGQELADRIKKIVEESGCEKVNIIAHSKGGLDSRAAISAGASPYVASLTTINTPHLGCSFADWLLDIASPALKEKVAAAYNLAASALGDRDPDFLAAVSDLTAENCKVLNEELTVPQDIYTRSVTSRMKKALGGKFPLNFTYLLAEHFDGDGDGLVAVENARWGDDFTLVTPKFGRGISHGDMIDLNRENIPGFDVREFYVQLVSELKERGL